MEYEIERDVKHPRFADGWHLAYGGDLPCRVWFKLSTGADGQLICTEVDIDSKRPITSSLLRKIPMSDIVDRLLNKPLRYEDRGGMLDLASGLRDYYDGGSIVGLTLDQIQAGGSTANMSKEELDDIYLNNSTAPPVYQRPKRGGRGPVETELQRFATAYKRALQLDRRHAINKTLELLALDDFHISRATANRWREECRKTDPPLLDPQ